MAPTRVSIESRLAWWWTPYMQGLILAAILMKCEPNWDKVHARFLRAIQFRINRGPWKPLAEFV